MLNNYFWWINVEFGPLWFCCVTVFCSFIDLSDFFAPMRQRWECCRTPKGRERRAFFASSVGRLSWRVFALLHFNGHIQYGIVWPWNSQKAPEAPDLFHHLSPTFHHFSPFFTNLFRFRKALANSWSNWPSGNCEPWFGIEPPWQWGADARCSMLFHDGEQEEKINRGNQCIPYYMPIKRFWQLHFCW